MLKLLLKLSLFLPVVVLVIVTNYLADPAHLFSNGNYEMTISKLLLNGSNVAGVENYDERILQRYLIQGMKAQKDIIVLGSSRTMMIGRNVSKENIFNNCVSGASIEDDMAVYWLYRTNGILPKRVIIGLDPWLLNKSNGQTRYKSIEKEYLEFLRTINKDRSDCAKIRIVSEKTVAMFSLTYFKDSYKKMIIDIFNMDPIERGYYPTVNRLEDVPVKRTDGTFAYDRNTRNLTVDEVKKIARNFVTSEQIYSLENYHELNSELKRTFESFVDFMKKDGVEVMFVLPPYHPIVYDGLANNDKYEMVEAAENYFREYAQENGIEVYGSYNPHVLQLTESDFFDGMHPKNEAVEKYLSIHN